MGKVMCSECAFFQIPETCRQGMQLTVDDPTLLFECASYRPMLNFEPPKVPEKGTIKVPLEEVYPDGQQPQLKKKSKRLGPPKNEGTHRASLLREARKRNESLDEDPEIARIQVHILELTKQIETIKQRKADPLSTYWDKIKVAYEDGKIITSRGKNVGNFKRDEIFLLMKAGLISAQKRPVTVIRDALWFTPEAVEKIKLRIG